MIALAYVMVLVSSLLTMGVVKGSITKARSLRLANTLMTSLMIVTAFFSCASVFFSIAHSPMIFMTWAIVRVIPPTTATTISSSATMTFAYAIVLAIPLCLLAPYLHALLFLGFRVCTVCFTTLSSTMTTIKGITAPFTLVWAAFLPAMLLVNAMIILPFYLASRGGSQPLATTAINTFTVAASFVMLTLVLALMVMAAVRLTTYLATTTYHYANHVLSCIIGGAVGINQCIRSLYGEAKKCVRRFVMGLFGGILTEDHEEALTNQAKEQGSNNTETTTTSSSSSFSYIYAAAGDLPGASAAGDLIPRTRTRTRSRHRIHPEEDFRVPHPFGRRPMCL